MDNLPKFFGTAGMIPLVARHHFDSANGWISEYPYKGKHADINAGAVALADNGYQVSVEPIGDSPLSLLVLTVGTGSPVSAGTPDPGALQTIWTLNATIETRALSEVQYFAKEILLLSDTDVAAMNKYILAVRAGQTPIGPLPPALATTAMAEYIKLSCRGVDTFFWGRWELQKRMVVAPQTNLQLNQTNIWHVFTKAQLEIAEAIPPSILFQLPADSKWLKQPGSTEQMNDGKFEFHQLYLQDDKENTWNPIIYPPAV